MIDYLNEEQMKTWGLVWGLHENRVICKKCRTIFDYDSKRVGEDYFVNPKDPGGAVTCRECHEKNLSTGGKDV